MNSFVLPFCISLLAGISTLIGTIPIFLKIKQQNVNKFITFCLAFSLSIMIGISVFDLIPNAFFELTKKYSLLIVMGLFLVSFLINLLLIKLINKKIDTEEKGSDLYKLGILNMLVLILHNLPEGIATFLSSYENINLGLKLSFAIMLHNIPEGLCIAVPIYYATKNRKLAIKYTLMSGLSEPLGAVLSFIFFKQIITPVMIDIVLIFVACLMIILSIEKIFPKAKVYNEDKYIFFGLIVGIITIVVSLLL